MTALLHSLRPALPRRAAARSARSREADEHERGGVHRASRGGFVAQVRARGAAAPRAARGHWGLVRLLLLSLGAARLLSSSSRFQRAPTGGKTDRPPKPPTSLLRHLLAFTGTTTGTQPTNRPHQAPNPHGSWSISTAVPIPPLPHTITSRHLLAPPARVARSRRPLAPPARAARSRRPLALSAHAATSLHRHQALMANLDLPLRTKTL